MFLEYQTRVSSKSPVYSAGMDAVAADGRTLSGSGAKDENNLSADPDADLSDHAVDKWYHRKIPLNALNGSDLVELSLAFKTGGHSGGVYRAFFDNIQITDGHWILETIYANEANFPLNEPAPRLRHRRKRRDGRRFTRGRLRRRTDRAGEPARKTRRRLGKPEDKIAQRFLADVHVAAVSWEDLAGRVNAGFWRN